MESMTSVWIKLMQIGHYCGCHQMPDRSFFLFGYQFPLCARCTGMLVGEIFAYVLLLLKKIFSPIVSLIFLGIMGVDWFIQFIEIASSTNFRRLITGFFGGLGVTFLFFHFVFRLVNIVKTIGKST